MISAGFVLSCLATAAMFVITCFLAFEDWAVYHSDASGQPPGDNTITSWTRYAEYLLSQHDKSHWLALAFGALTLLVGVIVGHLAWH